MEYERKVLNMKRTLLIVTVLLISFTFGPKAFGRSASALLDDNCSFHNASFTIPANKSAKNVRMTLSSSWLPCGGTGTPSRIGGRILSPGGNSLYYGVKYRDGRSTVLSGNLAGLVLAPGTYTVEVRDGGKMTRASVNYDLAAAAPPTVPATAAVGGSGWGTISGDWTDPMAKSSAKITQSSNAMTMTNSLKWQGKTVTWRGSGTINGNEVRFNYSYVGYKPEGWENGNMVLTRTSKKQLKGRWTTSSGSYSANIMFLQKRSDDPAPTARQQPTRRRPAARTQPSQAPIDRGSCPPHYIYGGPGRCMPPTMKKEER
jgi:hypothetical protein